MLSTTVKKILFIIFFSLATVSLIAYFVIPNDSLNPDIKGVFIALAIVCFVSGMMTLCFYLVDKLAPSKSNKKKVNNNISDNCDKLDK